MDFTKANDNELLAVLRDLFATDDDKQQAAAEIMKRKDRIWRVEDLSKTIQVS